MSGTQTEQNPVEARLDYLGALWEQFAANPQAHLLRWVVEANARQIVDVFVELHQTDPAGIPDVFIPFNVPFQNEKSYAADLIAAWRTWFEGIKDDLPEIARDPNWNFPAPPSNDVRPAHFVRVCQSFREKYGAEFRNLSIVLAPPTVADPVGWSRWLRELVRCNPPAEVRFLVLDDAQIPLLADLVAGEPVRVMSQRPEIDINHVYEELLAAAGGKGPGVVFRKHFVGMLTASGAGDLAAAEKSGQAALAVSAAENWPDLQVVAHMGLASVLIAAGRSVEALAGYRSAIESAKAAEAAGHPAGAILVVQSQMAEAGSLFSAGKYADAAAIYERTAPKAAAANDALLAMENWRMAAACHEQTKNLAKSWECGELALAAGAKLDDALRPNTTLTFAGHGMLRLTADRKFADRKAKLTATMNTLVGSGWETRQP